MSAKRRVVKRGLRFERWRVIVWFRYFHGFGLPRFEFEFRLGRPAPVEPPGWIVYEDDLA